MKRLFLLSLFALTTASAGAQQFGPAIGPPPGGVPANPAPSRFPPLTELKSESGCWPTRDELTRVRALLVGDTTDALGEMFQKELDKVHELLTAAVGADKLDVTVLKGNDASPQRILEYYRDLSSGKDEAIVFYYAGHGCQDTARQFDPVWARGHMMGMHAGGLYRADLFKAMKAKKAGLTVLISDCCSSNETTPHTPAHAGGTLPEVARGSAEQVGHVGRCLFLQHRGVVDLTAALDGHFAYGNGETIGMTPAICRVFHSPQQFLPGGGRGFVGWGDFNNATCLELWMMLGRQQADFTQCTSGFVHGRLAGSPWVCELEGGGRSNWSFYHLGDGRYKALEFGMGNADATARLNGYDLQIDFATADGTAGTYDVNIYTGAARCTFTKGALAGRVLNATLTEGEYDKTTNQVRKAE